MAFLQYSLIKSSVLQELKDVNATLRKEIDDAKSFIKNVEEGKLDMHIVLEKHQETGLFEALLEMQKQLKILSEEEQRQNWITTGLAKFAEIQQANYDIKTFGDLIIAQLVNYLKACQGGLFTLKAEGEEEPFLEMISCYAYDRKKFLKKQIYLGEGLLGQVFLERKTLHMDRIPEGYMNINSGLGDAPPSYLLLVPLKQQGEAYGILELASFDMFEPHQIEFLERIGESIASAISTVKVNERTKRLLLESQEQAEMLRAQEEEMRQNNEELVATQESLESKQMELQKSFLNSNKQAMQLKKQEKKLIASEKKMQAIIDNIPKAIFWKDNDLVFQGCNTRFAQIVGLETATDIVGKTEQDLPWSAEVAALFHQNDAEVLESNIPQVNQYKQITDDHGVITQIRLSKVPLIDVQGRKYGILGISEDLQVDAFTDNDGLEQKVIMEEMQKNIERLKKELEKSQRENQKLQDKLNNIQENGKNDPIRNN